MLPTTTGYENLLTAAVDRCALILTVSFLFPWRYWQPSKYAYIHICSCSGYYPMFYTPRVACEPAIYLRKSACMFSWCLFVLAFLVDYFPLSLLFSFLIFDFDFDFDFSTSSCSFTRYFLSWVLCGLLGFSGDY